MADITVEQGHPRPANVEVPSGDDRIGRFRARFVVVSALLICLTSLPFLGFVYQKYHGLQSGEADTGEDVGTETDNNTPAFDCFVRLNIPNVKIAVKAEKCLEVTCRSGTSCTLNEFQNTSDQRQETKTDPDKKEDVDLSVPSNEAKYALWQWAAILSIAITFSIIGVASSIIFRERDLHHYLVLRFVGSIAVIFFLSVFSAVLLLCLFVGGYLKGGVFPEFRSGTERFGLNSWISTEFRVEGWAKLAVWAYIAGFYERFIPGVFDKLLKSSEEGKQAARPERARQPSLP